MFCLHWAIFQFASFVEKKFTSSFFSYYGQLIIWMHNPIDHYFGGFYFWDYYSTFLQMCKKTSRNLFIISLKIKLHCNLAMCGEKEKIPKKNYWLFSFLPQIANFSFHNFARRLKILPEIISGMKYTRKIFKNNLCVFLEGEPNNRWWVQNRDDIPLLILERRQINKKHNFKVVRISRPQFWSDEITKQYQVNGNFSKITHYTAKTFRWFLLNLIPAQIIPQKFSTGYQAYQKGYRQQRKKWPLEKN